MTKAKNHTDIKSDGWVLRVLPSSVRPYALLMRLDRPIGTWLLLLPGWWAIVLAAGGGAGINESVFQILVLFGIGSVVMRGAGCVINDLWDRKIDRQVERTKARPLASGALGVRQALLFLVLLLLSGLGILLQLSPVAVLLGFISVPLIAVYPLMKRWTWWPQAFLGLTFNFGALMGWAAVHDSVGAAALLLYFAGIFWTLGYDTIYAHQDREDDLQAGVKSTALRLGERSPVFVAGFYAAALVLMLCSFALAGAGTLSFLLLIAAGLHPVWQVRSWKPDDPENTLALFRSNRVFGLLVLLAAIL